MGESQPKETVAEWLLALRPGDHVRVLGDDAREFETFVRRAPWQLGHGEWVVGLYGHSGGYLLRLVRAVIPSEPTDNQEIEAGELAVRGLHTCAVCRLPRAPLDRSVCEACVPREPSQARVIGIPAPRTWDEYEAGCLATFGGGYQTEAEREVFRHGMQTVFNLLRREFPDACNPDNRGITWWMRVAEAKQEERDRYRAALELVAQIRHVSGSAQAAFRCNLRVIDAALEGADFRDAAVTEAVMAGTWRPTKHPEPGPQ